jgi:hypothetical protein
MKNIHRHFEAIGYNVFMFQFDYTIEDDKTLQVHEVKTFPILEDQTIGKRVNATPSNITDQVYDDVFLMMKTDKFDIKHRSPG